ncbi:hypothetical protein GCM10007972_24470 [Iodidimonas muriae]|uniref:RNA polymerase sigma-70 region 2 domain-containing protein n=1 Tax=Iodidimonas muriae TaxID=261467 RepID=A0ABQ2LFU5_9PROT|nr:sigma factor [Iodidimonas muriae]GGO15901.1 hypothetical protein GCM10007972_24470 [Iodidimonas muriae]
MPDSISRSDLQILLREADSAARRLVRKLRLPRAELDDVRQDLLADLTARLPAFDPARGALGAFAGIILRNQGTRIADRVRRERRLYGAVPVSLDEALPDGDGATRGDLIAEGDGLAAVLGQPADAFAEVERRLDVERGLGALAPDDGVLCAALSRTTIDQLAALGRGARSSLYRRVRDIRLTLLTAGIAAA